MVKVIKKKKKPISVLNKKKTIKKILKKKTNVISKKSKIKIVKKISKKVKKVVVNKKSKIVKKQIKKVVKRKVSKKIKKTSVSLKRFSGNPVMAPMPYSWESQAVFNPGAVLSNGVIHLFYRALGDDGISRIGYASSYDGINFKNRLSYPVYFLKDTEETKSNWPFTSPVRPIYDKALFASGGGWGGCEDPRAVLIDGVVYMTFNVFNMSNGWRWDSMRVAVVSIKEEDLLKRKWIWNNFSYLSHYGDRQKNWVLFPEKFNGKFAIFHNLDKGDSNSVFISYVNKLDTSETPTVKDAPDPQVLPDHIVAWHKRTRSAASPPIKTKDGWLLLYHAMDKDDRDRYKLGALLLDLKDPQKVLYRAQSPILEPDEWYENDWKPGIIYASGAVLKNDTLFVYYGGGDKYIGVASISLSTLIKSMKENKVVKLEKNKQIKL